MRNDGTRRITSGIPGFDQMIYGGFFPGDSTLVAGSPGTGKTTFGLQFIREGVNRGEPGVFVTFEYLPQQIYRDCLTRGWDLKAAEEAGKARVLCTSPDVLVSEVHSGRSILDDAIAELGATRVVIDSMNHFGYVGIGRLRDHVVGLMNRLRMLGVTSMVTHEVPQIVGPTVQISDYGLEFLVDNVVILRFLELDGTMQKALHVLKFRGGDHDRGFRAYHHDGTGIKVEAQYKDIEGVSSGIARRSIKRRLEELI